MENLNLQFHNYQIRGRQRKEIEHKLEHLVRQIPCSSIIFLDFEYKKNGSFYGKMKVDMDGRRFFAEGGGVLLSSLTGFLCKKIQKQVVKWKKKRTAAEVTGIIDLKSAALKRPPPPRSSYKKAA